MIGALVRYLRREKVVALVLLFLGAAIVFARVRGQAEKPDGESALSEGRRLETTQKIEKVTEDWAAQLQSDPKMRTALALIGVVGAGLVVWDILLLFGWRAFGRFLRIRPVESPGWGLGTPVKLLVYLFFIEWVLATVGGWIRSGRVVEGVFSEVSWITFATVIRCVVLGGLMFRIARGAGASPWSEMGFAGQAVGRQILGGLAAYAGLIPVFLLVVTVASAVMNRLGYEPPAQMPLQMIYEEKHPLTTITLFIFVAVVGPVFEEILFRSFWYRALRARLGVFRGVLVSGVLFAVLHAHGAAFVPILVLGIGLTLLYEFSGSVIPGCVLHATHNGLMFALALTLKNGSVP